MRTPFQPTWAWCPARDDWRPSDDWEHHPARQPHARAMLVQPRRSCVARSHRPAQELGRAPREQAPQAGRGRAAGAKLAGVWWAMWRDGTFYDLKGHAEQSKQGDACRSARLDGRAQALQRAAKSKLRTPGARQLGPAHPNLRRRGCCRSPTVPLLRGALRGAMTWSTASRKRSTRPPRRRLRLRPRPGPKKRRA